MYIVLVCLFLFLSYSKDVVKGRTVCTKSALVFPQYFFRVSANLLYRIPDSTLQVTLSTVIALYLEHSNLSLFDLYLYLLIIFAPYVCLKFQSAVRFYYECLSDTHFVCCQQLNPLLTGSQDRADFCQDIGWVFVKFGFESREEILGHNGEQTDRSHRLVSKQQGVASRVAV